MEAGSDTNMIVLVHVRQRTITVACGDGSQPVRWLANVGITRHDESLGRSLGAPVSMKMASGQLVPLDQTLVDAGIRNGQHVWVVLKGLQPTTEKARTQNKVKATACKPSDRQSHGVVRVV